MADGVYTSMEYILDIQAYLSSSRAVPRIPRTATFPPQETSSFDALMKLKDLTECIEDAANTQALVCRQIELLIKENKSRNDAMEAAVVNAASAQATKSAAAKERKDVQKLRDEKTRRLADLQSRRVNIDAQRKAQTIAEQQCSSETLGFQQTRVMQDELRTSTTGQIRRVAQDLLDVFPIEPIQGHFLCFTICNKYLPNAKAFEDDTTYKGPPMDSETTSAALGFATQIIVQLELYLGIPLPYEPHVCGSTSSIFDPLSSVKELGLASSSGIGYRSSPADAAEDIPTFQPPTPENYPYRSFPLYQQGVQSKRFRWAIYLLNKDIEELMQQSGCKVMDPRTTLANLKYLLSVLASGKGELPGRKVGVVRGLDRAP